MTSTDGMICASSLLYGRGVYRWEGEMTVDPFDASGAESPILINAITKERYFVRKLGSGLEYSDALIGLLLKTPAPDLSLWPADCVKLSDELSERCDACAYREYVEEPTPPICRDGSYGLLFADDDTVPYDCIHSRIELLGDINWRNEEIRSIAVSIARGFDRLNAYGYVYPELSLDRLFLSPNGETFFDFSPLCLKISDYSRHSSKIPILAEGQYPIEFAEPALVSGKVMHADLRMQNYSLAALFMYLLMGKYAYDGPLLMGYSDDTPQEHYIKFREYHKMPVFIFDPIEKENSLGTFAEDIEVIELWESMPEILRTVLVRTLARPNALRIENGMNPTAGMWLRIFESLGWDA